MKYLLLLPFLLGCGGTAQSRRAKIEEVEDKFCALRAKEKSTEDQFDLNPYEGTAGATP